MRHIPLLSHNILKFVKRIEKIMPVISLISLIESFGIDPGPRLILEKGALTINTIN